MTSHPDEGTLHAYIDGELPSSEAAALELHVRGCERCAASLAEARGFVAAASRAISALDEAPSSGAPAAAAAINVRSRHAQPRRRLFRVPFARAAALLLLAGGTAVVVNQSGIRTTEKSAQDSASFGFGAADAPTSDTSTVVSEAAPAADQLQLLNAPPARERNPAGRRAVQNPRAAAPLSGGDAALKAAPPGRAGTGIAAGTVNGTLGRERAGAPDARVADLRDAAPAQPRPSGAAVADAPVLAPPPPPAPTSAVARAEPLQERAVTTTGSTSPVRVTRLRTKAGVVLTLIEEPIRATAAEDASVARRNVLRSEAMRTTPSSAQAAAASAAPPVVNSYRWTSVEQGRTYTLTGPMTVAELEAAARKLGELERIP